MNYQKITLEKYGGPEVLKLIEGDSLPEPEAGQVRIKVINTKQYLIRLVVSFNRSFKCLQPGGELVAYGFYNSVMGKGGNSILDFIKLFMWNILPNGKKSSVLFNWIAP